jgi:hypothetical protein
MLSTSLKISRFMKLSRVFFFTVIAFLFLSVNSFAFETEVDLIAGQHTAVGKVIVTDNGYTEPDGTKVSATKLYITYNSVWYMSATHLEVRLDPRDVPQSNGNPIPGRFSYKKDHNPPVTNYTYEVSLTSSLAGAKLYIAAHADVCTVGEYVDYNALKTSPSGTISFDLIGSNESFVAVVIDGITYKAYCVNELDGRIVLHADTATVTSSYDTATVTSSYDPNTWFLVAHPEYLDCVNYIINNYYADGPGPNGIGIATIQEIQCAIWFFTDGKSMGGPISEAIIQDALDNGAGYIPPIHNGYVALIINPIDENGNTIAQKMIILVDVPTKTVHGCETAWAGTFVGTTLAGVYDFPGSNWAMYFEYASPYLPPVSAYTGSTPNKKKK